MSARQWPAGCALEIAYGDYRRSLIRYLSGKLDNRDQAEDLAQDVFLVLAQLRSDVPVRNPRSFLLKIASNLAINRNSREGRRTALRAQQADILWTAVDEITPERHLIAADMLLIVEQALDALPERTREILRLRRLDGLTNVEIAAKFGISTTAVEKHLRKAIAHLVDRLGAAHE